MIDVDGIESQESVRGRLLFLSRHKRPVVRILQPQPLSLATPDVKLPVTVMAEDDYGITQLTLFRSLNGSPAVRSKRPWMVAPARKPKWQLPLPSYGLELGMRFSCLRGLKTMIQPGLKELNHRSRLCASFRSRVSGDDGPTPRCGEHASQVPSRATLLHQLASALEDVQAAQKALEEAGNSPEAQAKLQEKLAAAQRRRTSGGRDRETERATDAIDVDKELAKELAANSQQAAEMAQQLMK